MKEVIKCKKKQTAAFALRQCQEILPNTKAETSIPQTQATTPVENGSFPQYFSR